MSLIETREGDGITAIGRSTEGRFRAARDTLHQLDTSVVVAQTSPQRLNLCRSLRINQDELIVIHMHRRNAGHGMTEPHARAEAYAACVHLEEFVSYDLWCDERHESSQALGEGAIHINDMRRLWRADIRSSFHVVNFYITQSALDEVSEEYGCSGTMELRCPMSNAFVDNVVKNLALALLPAIAHPDEANKLFLECAARAVTVHLANTYGSLRCQLAGGRGGGLAPWQERRAKELLRANLSGSLGLIDLADACRLSASHFSQAFKQTVGCPPHRWLIGQRVEQAKRLMLNTDQSLSEIALGLGFSDQSHFTRVFSRWVRTSPAAWRRAQES
jgi:AraC family transcriptional regulator